MTKKKRHAATTGLVLNRLASNLHAVNGHHEATDLSPEVQDVVAVGKNENHVLRNLQIDLVGSSLASRIQRLQLVKAKAVEFSDLRALLRSFRISRPGKRQLAALRFARQPKNTPDALKIVVDATVADGLRVAEIN